ncbi:DUF4158 domain-containing protein [Amaricoccus sp. W119]|uniref:DUF4158 domain-containing protein n=1 Tax=Amaricoccus sp. W119 TaxID=3391833 RepID=UPI0039A4A334
MAHRRILTAGQRRALFGIPDDEGECRRRYALEDDDLWRIGRRRKPGNRLGFALQLCALDALAEMRLRTKRQVDALQSCSRRR